MLRVNENLVKISAGKVVTPFPLNLGEDVDILIEGTVVKSEDADNNDGSVDRTFVVKGIIAEVLKSKERE